MFKKSTLFVVGLFISQLSIAEIVVTVKNDSSLYDINIASKDVQISSFMPEPIGAISAGGSDRYSVFSRLSNVVRIVDVDYNFGPGPSSSINPGCHFRYTIISDFRTKSLIPSAIIADAEGGTYRDRAMCSGKIDSFNLSTGDSTITLSINRRKF